jgi:hypothetical protein
MHGRRTALRYSPSTPSPAGARSRGQSTVLPFGSGWSAPSPSWRVPGGRCVRRVWQHATCLVHSLLGGGLDTGERAGQFYAIAVP